MNGAIHEAWNKLAAVRTLTFRATSAAAAKTGWVGEGTGSVEVETPDALSLIFRESGTWTNPQGRELTFHNTYRWRLTDNVIQLEHLRFGADSPVFLFALEAVAPEKLASACPHVCSEDRYRAVMKLGNPLRLCWTIKGPVMDETIEYEYACAPSRDSDSPRGES